MRLIAHCRPVSVLIALLVLGAGNAFGARPDVPPAVAQSVIVPGRYIVVLRDDVPSAAAVARDLSARQGLAVSHVYENALKGFAAAVPAGRLLALQFDPRVAFVEPDQTAHAFAQAIPTGVKRIFASDNLSLGIDGADDGRVDVDVAVIDTGIADHPDLNIVARTNCSGGGPFTQSCADGGTDGNGHGTHVAGTIGALDNGIGVVGVAPGARLWSVKVLGDNGSGYISWIIAGIDWVTARADQIEVANMSLGCECSSSALNTAITNSVKAGVVHVVAAGNSDKDAATFSPANHPDVITVSALADFDGQEGGTGSPTCRADQDDTLADFSNWGSLIEIAAPGVCILSTWKDGGYTTISGTSMASPHVAGAAGLLASGPNKPTNKAGVDAIRSALIGAGNHQWTDDSGDGIHEPLLDVSTMAAFMVNGSDTGGGGSDDPPSVSITSPENNATVSETITIAATAGDDNGVSQVEFFVDSASVGTDSDGSNGWSVSWNTTSVGDGGHTITATATDTQGQTASDSITVNVSNGAGGEATTSMGVFAINPTVSRHVDITINIRRDSDGSGGLTSDDAAVGGATVTLVVTRNSADTWTFVGNTNNDGNFRAKLVNAPAGNYTAEVTNLSHGNYTWDPSLDVLRSVSFQK